MWYTSAKRYGLDHLYDSDLPEIKTEEIEGMLEEQNFSTDAYKGGSRKMEASRSVPMMSVAFQRAMDASGRIPTADEFLSTYEESNDHFIRDLDEKLLKGLRHRAMRAYPSLVRDIHFVALAREMGAKVRRTLREDIRGIDATVETADGPRFIRLYFDSPRSRRYRVSKAMVHTISKEHVDVPLTKDNANEFGNVYLYSPHFVSGLLRDIGAIDDQEDST